MDIGNVFSQKGSSYNISYLWW